MADLLNRAKNVINSSQNIIIFTKEGDSKESYDAGLSLYYSLKKLDKNVKLGLREDNDVYSILINTEDKLIKEISYDKKESWLQLNLSLEQGTINKNDIVLQQPEIFDEDKIDLVITVGIQKLPQLGDILEKKFKLFYELPILNIDNHEFNEKFGQVNLIKDSSLTYIVEELFKEEELQKPQFNDKINIPTVILKDSSMESINNTIKKIKDRFPTYLLLWENQDLMGAIFHSNIDKYLNVLQTSFSAQKKNNSLLIYKTGNNLTSFKEEITNKIWKA